MLTFKRGVKMQGACPEIVIAMFVFDQIVEEMIREKLIKKQVTRITSIVEGKHSYTSLHYIGHAFDGGLLDRGALGLGLALPPNEIAVKRLKAALTDEFDVILEGNHFHIEFQPKRRK